jgi:hypothetical protein
VEGVGLNKWNLNRFEKIRVNGSNKTLVDGRWRSYQIGGKMCCRCEVAQLPARRQDVVSIRSSTVPARRQDVVSIRSGTVPARRQDVVSMRSGTVTSQEARCGVDAKWHSYQLGGKKRC